MEERIQNTDIYANKVYELADDWAQARNITSFENFRKNMATDLILYIHDRLVLPTPDQINELDQLFDAYVHLCARFSIRPTLYQFSLLCGIGNDTFSDWLGGEYRTKQPIYAQSVKKWKKLCEGVLAADLTNSDGSSANMIFALKSAYGWTEIAPLQIPADTTTHLKLTDLKLPELKGD